ncbi:hypothetical protein EMCRGX_G016095 [Ephydatia muelleri]
MMESHLNNHQIYSTPTGPTHASTPSSSSIPTPSTPTSSKSTTTKHQVLRNSQQSISKQRENDSRDAAVAKGGFTMDQTIGIVAANTSAVSSRSSTSHQSLYDSSATSQWSIVQLGNAIKDFFNTFDATFKGARTITMHILEHHMLDWIRSHQVGCGLMGEQGAELGFNSLAATYKTIPDPIDRLNMKEHYCST